MTRCLPPFAPIALLLLAGCSALSGPREPPPLTPKSEVKVSPVVREALPAVQPAPTEAAPAQPATATGTAPSLASATPTAAPVPPPAWPAIPPNTLYVCRMTAGSELRQTAIEFEPKVHKLCARHPEMGVCQYEREGCRTGGGRVFDAKGIEITKQIEAEYDRKVMRIRFRAG